MTRSKDGCVFHGKSLALGPWKPHFGAALMGAGIGWVVSRTLVGRRGSRTLRAEINRTWQAGGDGSDTPPFSLIAPYAGALAGLTLSYALRRGGDGSDEPPLSR